MLVKGKTEKINIHITVLSVNNIGNVSQNIEYTECSLAFHKPINIQKLVYTY